MSKTFALYNPKANSSNGEQLVKGLEEYISDVEYIDITKVKYSKWFKELAEDDQIVVCGGDGTLNRFVNDTAKIKYNNKVLYFPMGTGNDFYREMTNNVAGGPIEVNEVIKKLPVCTINGKKYKFINGVGYGIDGYCCEVGDKKREKSNKSVNYTAIAIKGCLFSYKPTKCKVIVDGVEYNYKKVWIAPTMKGKHYGGGMIPTPGQDRFDKNGTLSLCIFRGNFRIKVLMIFASIFKGEHIKHPKNVIILRGKNIQVSYDKPRPAQIDGETILNVSEYYVKA